MISVLLGLVVWILPGQNIVLYVHELSCPQAREEMAYGRLDFFITERQHSLLSCADALF